MAGLLKIGFLNVEGLRKKVGNKDFLDLLGDHDVFRSAELCRIWSLWGKDQKVAWKEKAKFSRNLGGLVDYVREGLDNRVTKMSTNMKAIIWLGVRKKRNLQKEICMGFVYSASETL